MATYSSDLTTLTTAESGTWTEFDSPYNGGGSPAANAENFIQGTGCYSQTTGKAVGLEISVVFNNGSGYTFATDEVVFAWCYYAIGTNIETYANSGWRFGIGSGTGAWDWFKVGGNDFGRNPYGGWTNFAIDPTATETGTIGGGNGGTYQYFGSIPYTLAEISKGEPSAMDAIRAGRGEISVTGTGGTFAELAEYNDYNAGGTPPGTSSTSIDTGRHRLGLFQEQGGTYLWKGLMSLGLTATSATFTDSNVTIIIEDCPHTYASFNKVEVNHASSAITLTNATFIAIGTTAPGDWEMVADATATLTTCSFNSMGTFIFDSNTTADTCSFNSCGLITAAEADLSGSSVLTSTVAADEGAVFDDRTTSASVDMTEYSEMTFSKGTNSHHALRFGTGVTHDITLTGIDFTGFGSVADATDAVFRFDATSGSLNLNLVRCTTDGTFSVDDAAGIAVTVVIDPITELVNVKNTAGDNLTGARVFVETAATITSGEMFEAAVTSITSATGTATCTTTAAHGLVTGDHIVIRGAQPDDYNKTAEVTVSTTTIFTYSVTSGISSPATGTPVCSFVVLHGTTDGSGNISDARTWGADQQVKGWARKSNTSSPYHKQSNIAYTIDSTNGNTTNVVLQSDE